MPIQKQKLQYYMNNPKLKAEGVIQGYTAEQIQEIVKCSNDPIYFIEHYVKVVSIDKGIIPFILYDYQKRIINAIHHNRKIIAKLFRQSGKSTVLSAYILYFVLFNPNKEAAILANKFAQAVEIFGRVRFMYEELPNWIKPGVVEYNKTSFKLENGSKAFCAASSPSAVRGKSLALLLCDEFAFLGPTLADEFMASVFPTLSSSNESKLVLISTPNGKNHFYKIWKEAEDDTNGFVAVQGHYTESRSEEWAQQQLKLLGTTKFNAEILCQFAGSSYTLVDGNFIDSIVVKKPIIEKCYDNVSQCNTLRYFEECVKGHDYLMTVDVSRGRDRDYSAFSVFDITRLPYKVVCTFKNNHISTTEYPSIIDQVCKYYNNALILIENNDMGESVALDLWNTYENENVLWTNRGEIRGGGIIGIKTIKQVKVKGQGAIKDIVESGQIELNDSRIIEELSVFVLGSKGTYEAQDTKINDDLMTTLWLFGYIMQTEYFQNYNETNVNRELAEQIRAKQLYDDLCPVGFSTEWENDEPNTPQPDFYSLF